MVTKAKAKPKAKPGRAPKYAPGTSRADKRRLRAEAKLERQGIQVKEEVKTDKELLADMVERFDVFRRLIRGCAEGALPSILVPGAPGIGKSWNASAVLRAMEDKGVMWKEVRGGISASELYALGYKYRHKGNVILLDDTDKVFRDEDTMNILKALTDSSKKRHVSWHTQTFAATDMDGERLEDESGVPQEYDFEGSIIMLSNKNFQAEIDLARGRNVEHMEAISSRALYLDLKIYNRHTLSLWINHVCTEGKMFVVEEIDPALGKELLAWLHANNAKLREYSLRTVHKLCELTRYFGDDWQKTARVTLCR